MVLTTEVIVANEKIYIRKLLINIMLNFKL